MLATSWLDVPVHKKIYAGLQVCIYDSIPTIVAGLQELWSFAQVGNGGQSRGSGRPLWIAMEVFHLVSPSLGHLPLGLLLPRACGCSPARLFHGQSWKSEMEQVLQLQAPSGLQLWQ